MELRNFLFHRVSSDKDELWPPMQPSLFEKVIASLMRRYDVVNLEDYLLHPSSFQKNKKPIATIVFDDGYKDNIELAAPILQMHRCPASFYVVTDCINRNIPTWTYIVDYCLQYTRKDFIELDAEYVPAALKKISLHNRQAPEVRQLKPWMKSQSNARRKAVMDAIVDQCGDVILPRVMMDWKDVKQLQDAGFVIGSHSHTHPMLARLENENEIEEELSISANEMEKHLGIRPTTISYPIGSYDDRVVAWAKKTGYAFGLAVEQRFYNTGIHDVYAIPRVELYQEPWWKVNMRINGAYGRLRQLWK